MADDVIKSFLVGLGFKIDKTQQTDFVNAIDKATKAAEGLAIAVAGAATAVAAAVYKMASDFDQLYWRTQRLGSSAVDIKAFGYAISQLGGSSQGAQQALERLAEFVKSSPGSANYLTRLGVDPRHLGDSVKTMQDLGAAMSRLPYWQQKVFADRLGIDPTTLQAMNRDLSKNMDQYKEMAERVGKVWGVNFGEMGDSSNEFMSKLRQMKAELDLNFTAATYRLLEKLNPLIERFVHWIEESSENGKFQKMADNIYTIVAAVAKLVDKIIEFNKVVAIGGGALMGARAGAAFGPWGALAGAIVGGAGGAWAISGNGSTSSSTQNGPMSPMPSASGGMSVPNNVMQRFNAATAFFEKMGYSKGGARGMAATLYAESGLNENAINPSSGAMGLAQWLSKDRIAAIQGKFGSIQGSSFGKQLEMVDWELKNNPRFASLRRNLQNPYASENASAAGMIHSYEAPGAGTSGDMYRASQILGGRVSGGVVLNQNTTIHSNGGSDPRTIAQNIAQEQNGVNNRLMSSFKRYAF
jgi:hypothetical protein